VIRTLLRLVLLLSALVIAADRVPTFKQLPATEKFSGKPAIPVLKTRAQRNFRTRIREAAQEGPNFAGRFTIAEWGCGAGCVSIAVIDERNGAVFSGPFEVLAYGGARKYEGGEDGLEYKIDSRLLVARGCPEENNCGSYYYEWNGTKFLLLRKVPASAEAK
jgi:hypothetical protein